MPFIYNLFDWWNRNTSKQYQQLLHSLGGEINHALQENLTHYICENVSIKRILAARFLGIVAVSPKWIVACQSAGKRVDETPFYHTSELVELITSIDGKSSDFVPIMSEPAEKLALALRSINSPLVSSRHTHSSPCSLLPNHHHPKSQPPPSQQAKRIPLPSYREHCLPRVLPGVFKRRRSDRIIDMQESDSDEEYDKSISKICTELVGCNENEIIDKDEVMPVIYVKEPIASVLDTFQRHLATKSTSDIGRIPIRKKRKH